MKTDKEVFEALLAGEILLGQGCEYKLEKGVLMIKVFDRWKPADYGYPHRTNVQIKKRTININGHEVPEPLRVAPSADTIYWVPSLCGKDYYINLTWINDEFDLRILKKGILHLSKEAAIAHAKALLSFTKKEEE